MASGFDEKALADAYAMAAGMERLAEECPEVYDYHFAENEVSLNYNAPEFNPESLEYEEPTFDPRNKRGSTKKRGSDSLNSSDTGVKLTAEQEIFYSDVQSGEGEDQDLDKYPELAEEHLGRKTKKQKKTETEFGEQNVQRRSAGLSRQKKQLLRAAVTDLSKDDLRRLANALLDEV